MDEEELQALEAEGFNPLFIGAWVRTCISAMLKVTKEEVSIPSSSGPGFGPDNSVGAEAVK